MKKINLLYIISNLGQGGAQVLLLDMINYLQNNKNIDIAVITIDSGEYIGEFNKKKIKTIDLKEKGLVNYNIYRKLFKIIKEIKPDIVHTNLLKADFYGRIASKNAGVKLIVSTYHTTLTSHSQNKSQKKTVFDYIDNFVVNYSNSDIIAVSEQVKKKVIERNLKAFERTNVIYNGIDLKKESMKLNSLEISEYKKKLFIKKNEFIVSIIGRLEESKGQFFFLKAMKDILLKGEIKILLVGEGSHRSKIENFISQYKIEKYVTLLGFVKEPEEIIEISDLICVPSIWEGFGLVIIEAMIKRKIVLASDTGGIPELISDGKTGFLFKSLNKEELIEKFNYIFKNSDKLENIKKHALKMVKQKFDIEKNSELYYNYYLQRLSK